MTNKYFKIYLFFLSLTATVSCSESNDENRENNTDEIYFPPLQSNTWASISASELGWNEDKLQPLLDFLEVKNTKGFIILYKGKIVVEEYFNGHNPSAAWYWASAGKTLTSTIVGIAKDEGLLNTDQKTSDFLGNGWTVAAQSKENLIKIENLLNMTSGLDETLGDDVSPQNLKFVADAGERWAYHNVYVKLQNVVEAASAKPWKDYFNLKLRDKIGMKGIWIPIDDLSVYWSDCRSMARFGLLMSANGEWDEAQIVSKSFLMKATNTSQTINEAYGYLWWLNGKASFHLPQSQLEFPGKLIPNATDDMYAALGKNDQKIYIVPSKDLVIIRMGEAAEAVNFALSNFDNDLWSKINDYTN